MNRYTLEELKIEVTYKCPLSCVHCSSNAGSNIELNIDEDKCLDIIHQAVEMGVKEIAFSGGEPLIWEGLSNCISLCNENGIKSAIYTSGNCDDIENVIVGLSRVGLNKAIFSVYSPIEQEHIRVTRQRDSFKKTIEAISVCRRNKITPEIHFVALASNYRKLIDVVDLAKSIGVNTVSVLRFVPQGRGNLIKDKDTLSQKQNKELIKIIKQIRLNGFNIRTGSPFNVLLLNDNPKCLAAINRMIIAPDLTIYPCDAFKQIKACQITEEKNNNTLENSTLKDCWNNSSYLNEIRRHLEKREKSECYNCNLYHKCLSGCLAQKFLSSGSLDSGKDPACLKLGEQYE